jgi:transposase
VRPEGGAEEREARLARRSPFAPESKLCPRCLSPLRSMNRDLIGFVPAEYYCPRCGYTGTVYVVRDKGSEGKE